MSNLRLMCRESYANAPATACGHHVDEWERLQDTLARCLADGVHGLILGEIWLIEADDEKGDTLDEVLLWSGKRE